MDRSFFTELTLRHKCPEDFGPTETIIRKVVWDGGPEMMMDLFHTVFISDSFSEEQWKQALVDELWRRFNIDVTGYIESQDSESEDSGIE